MGAAASVVSSVASAVGSVVGAGRAVVGFVGDVMRLREQKKKDNSFKDLIGILGNGFEHVINRTDRNYDAISENLRAIQENYQSIEQVQSLIHTTLATMVHRFDDVDGQFTLTRKELKEGFQRIEALITETEVKAVMSGLTTFIEDFTIKMLGLVELSHQERIATLKSNVDYFKTATTPQSPLSLQSLINRILDGSFAVPKKADDEVAFAALFLLSLGTDTYIDIFEFLMTGYEYLAVDHYSKSEVEDYNNYYSIAVATAKDFRNRLYGVGGEIGIIGKVIKEFEKVVHLDFIKNKKQGVVDVLTKKIKEFETTKQVFAEMNYLREQPNSRILFTFTECGIKTPFLKWHDNKSVQYAIQYVHNGTYTPVGEWTPITIYGKSCPNLDVGDAAPDTTRIIFRRFDQERPQMISMITDSNQTKVRDIDRDLYDAVLERNIDLAQKNADILLCNGANITATFELGRQAIHAAASAGHQQVIRELINKGANVNAQDSLGYSPLHIAAQSGNEELVAALIDLGADVELQTQDKWTALHMAAKHDHTKAMQVLLSSKKVNRNSRATGGFTPLHMVITSGQTRALEMLCADGQTDVNAGSETMTTPLHLAVLGQNKRAGQMLIHTYTSDVNAKVNGGLTPLHIAVAAGDTFFVQLLLGHNATDANCKSDDGWSPLHLAVSLKNYDVIKQLLNAPKTDVNIEGKDRRTPLHLASHAGETTVALDLLDHGAKLGLRDSRNYTPLHSSVENNHFETAKALIERGSVVRRDILRMAALANSHELVKYLIFNKNTLVDGQTPLHNAAAFGNVDLLKYVLEKCTNVNAKDDSDRTPLHYAVVSGNNDVVNFLVDKGADVQMQSSDESTPLAFAVSSGRLDIGKFLDKTKNATINVPNFKGQTPLHLATSFGRLQVAKHLLARGAQINAKDIFGQSSLSYAVRSKNLEFVIHLLGAKADLKVEDSSGLRLLLEAIRGKRLDIVELLIKSGVNPKADATPVIEASRLGYLDILKHLVANGADISASDASGKTALHYAVTCKSDNLGVMKYLIQTHKFNVNVKTKVGKSPLHYAVESGNLQAVKYLVEELKCDVTCKDENGVTPLHSAALSSNLETVKYLIENKFDINARTNDGATTLHLAAQAGSLDMVKYLIEEKKLDIKVKNNNDENLVLYAAMNPKQGTAVLKYLLDSKLDINEKRTDGLGVLYFAIMYCDLDVVKFVVEHGANVNAMTKESRSPLHFAAEKGNLNIVKFLLERGSDVNARNENRETPLHNAAKNGKLDVVQHLVNSGADVWAKDKNGDTPLHQASLAGYIDTAVYLARNCGCVYVKNKANENALDQAAKAKKVDVVVILKNNNRDVKALSLEDANPPLKAATLELHVSEDSAKKQGISEDSAVVDAETGAADSGLFSKGFGNHLDGVPIKRSRRSTGPRPWGAKTHIWQQHSVTGEKFQHYSWRAVDNPVQRTKVSRGWPNPQGVSFSKESSSAKDGSSNGLSTYSSSLNDNVFLAKWLLSLFGRRSFVDGMNKAERVAVGEPQTKVEWAERYLREGVERYYQQQ